MKRNENEMEKDTKKHKYSSKLQQIVSIITPTTATNKNVFYMILVYFLFCFWQTEASVEG